LFRLQKPDHAQGTRRQNLGMVIPAGCQSLMHAHPQFGISGKVKDNIDSVAQADQPVEIDQSDTPGIGAVPPGTALHRNSTDNIRALITTSDEPLKQKLALMLQTYDGNIGIPHVEISCF
jgi:hypothetical protein